MIRATQAIVCSDLDHNLSSADLSGEEEEGILQTNLEHEVRLTSFLILILTLGLILCVNLLFSDIRLRFFIISRAPALPASQREMSSG